MAVSRFDHTAVANRNKDQKCSDFSQNKLNQFLQFDPEMSHKTIPAALKGTKFRKTIFKSSIFYVSI